MKRVYGLVAISIFFISCTQAQPPAPAAPAASAPKPYGTLAQMMRGIPFPNSNIIFDTQSTDPAAAQKPPEAGAPPSQTFAGVYGGWQAVENAAIEAFTAKASLVASNVPGPADTIHIGGAAVRQLLFWVPQAGSIGTGVSLLSYDGRLQFGVMADRQLISDPARLAAAFVREFERLALLVALAREPGGHARRPRSVRARRAGGSPSRGSRSRRPGARAPRS